MSEPPGAAMFVDTKSSGCRDAARLPTVPTVPVRGHHELDVIEGTLCNDGEHDTHCRVRLWLAPGLR